MSNITSWADLRAMSFDDAQSTLMNDLLITDANYESIAGASANGGTGWAFATEGVYSKIFDGGGHKIQGLNINQTAIKKGLFGYAIGATIQNVILEDVVIASSTGFIGALVGEANNSTITKCSASGSVTGTGSVGGLIGFTNTNSTVSYCSSSCTVAGSAVLVGGLIGQCNDTLVSNSYALGAVSNNAIDTGGFVGSNKDASLNDAGAVITNCYAAGVITNAVNSVNIGGFTGENENGATTINCFFNSANTHGAWNEIGTPTSEVNLKVRATFENAGWDFTKTASEVIWVIDTNNNGFPYLDWQTFGSAGSVGFSGLLNSKLIGGGLLK